MYVLIDCDNFFVSCERAFQPKLNNRPVVVLSNNDGCVVARSAEAKTLGIPMGCPYFKIADLFREKHGAVLSSNYELYADMSHRVMNIIRSRLQNIEIYSVDEAFAEIAFTSETEAEILTLQQDILRQTGISVSIGIAPTKTLCKIAGDTAKKMSKNKICLLKDTAAAKPLLPLTDIGDVWGVGRKLKPRLNFLGLFTADDLAKAQSGLIRNHFGIHLEKTVLELNGTPCLPREQNDCQKASSVPAALSMKSPARKNCAKSWPNLQTAPANACADKMPKPAASSLIYVLTVSIPPNLFIKIPL